MTLAQRYEFGKRVSEHKEVKMPSLLASTTSPLSSLAGVHDYYVTKVILINFIISKCHIKKLKSCTAGFTSAFHMNCY